MATVTSTQNCLPQLLVDAVGQERLANMKPVNVQSTNDYFDGCFSLDMIPESGVIMGSDQYGRLYVTFAVHNPNYQKVYEQAVFARGRKEEVGLFTVFQRDPNGILSRSYCYRTNLALPTNDDRFFGADAIVDDKKYAAIGEVFAGKHPDLKLGVKPPRT